MSDTDQNGSLDSGVTDVHNWRNLDPLVKFGVGLAAILFLGVVVEGMLLVPYALIEHGWTPGTK